MKKEGIQSRNRKLSAKARKKHSSFTSAADMLKPLEKMYGYGMAGMAGSAMSSYYMPNTGPVGAAIPSLHNSASPSAAAASHQYAAASAAAGMHMMAASTLGGFGAATAPYLGGTVSLARSNQGRKMCWKKMKGGEPVTNCGAAKNPAVAPNRPFSLGAAGRAREQEGGRESRVQEGTLQSMADAVAAAAAAASQSTFEARERGGCTINIPHCRSLRQRVRERERERVSE